MACKIGLTVFFIVEAVALALFVIGTPLAIFRSETKDVEGNTACVTLWGYKTKCSDSKYDFKTKDIFDGSVCDSRKDLFVASEALSIISCVVFAACILMVLLMCCCSCVACICRVLLMILIVVGMFSAAATFACMAYVYNNNNKDWDDIVTDGEANGLFQVDLKNGVAINKSTSVAAMLSDAASDNGHLTSGSSPIFAAVDVAQDLQLCAAIKHAYKFGVGFILIIIGWALHTINIIFALLPC